jgi:hypothetical protein
MLRIFLQLGFVSSLLLFAAPEAIAQGPISDLNEISYIDPSEPKVENKRVCVSTTETQIDKCPTDVEESHCPAGNCDPNYTFCRIFGSNPNFEHNYAYSEVEFHEVVTPKEVVNANGVRAQEDGTLVCHKRQRCICDDTPGVSATCTTEDEKQDVVIKKWKKTTTPCITVRQQDPEEEIVIID